MSEACVHFIADLHLSADRPETLAAFARYISGPARAANALYILGDLFNAWPGDDVLPTPAAQLVVKALTSLSEAGGSIFFIAGNRDFLVGENFAKAAKLTLLQEPTPVALGSQTWLLMHGDSLCTDDVEYQKFRTMVRNPAWQAAVLAKPLVERLAFAADVRQKSEQTKQEKGAGIMAVNTQAVAASLRASNAMGLIHGHTHRPAHHIIDVDGRKCERGVLADWHDKAEWLEWRPDTGLSYQSW